ncbi:hypothetical protein J132_02590 [Termitomyces sp. J132]|nr:hypothetical protein H2248_006963 [Termitomyces sp. 'cryptogamus']KNZ72589.1 hypothetical protein J132_02590 [Termitomyces sp. J132]
MPRTSFQGTASRSQVSSNNNPRGINQYKDCPAPDDPRIPEFLKEYQRKGITDKKKISKFLLDEHGIIMSDSTVARRRRELGLKASGKTTADLPDDVKRQLVLDQMAKDTAGQIGTLTVKTRIFQETGIDLTRRWIGKEMRTLAPEAYEARRPHRKHWKGTSPTKHRLSGNSSGNGGSAGGEARLPVDSEPPRNRGDSFLAEDTEIIQDISPHDYLQLGHSRLVANTPSHIQLLAAPGSFIRSTQLQDMMAETEAKIITLTRYLRTLGPVTDVVASQNLLTCMESAALLEREIARVILK